MSDPKDDLDEPTPLPAPEPHERESSTDYASVAAEDRAAREAANLPQKAPLPVDAWDRAAAFLGKHGPLLGLAVITIAIAIIHGGIFRGETAGDDLSFHYAESARLYDCLRHGDFDFWNPSANAGYASLYYYQALPQLASALPAAIFGHHLFWFELSVVLPLIATPACAYKGMRLIGATPWQALAGAFCVAFMNGESRWGSGSAGTFNVGLYTQTWSLCAFPLALGYSLRWMTKGDKLAPAVAWLGFAFLCHPFGGGCVAFALVMAFCANALWIGTGVEDGGGRRIGRELLRASVLGALFIVTTLPFFLPFVVDYAGFGGFPHRVADEVGPGFKGLWVWYSNGNLLDFEPKGFGTRLWILTCALPIVVVFARGRYFRWLWAPCLLFVLMLGLGPILGKIGDDLLPPVRFLGAMQTLMAMGIGAGAVVIGTELWNGAGRWPEHAYALRTAIASATAALIVLIAVPGTKALVARVRVFGEPTRSELREISAKLASLPQGRKQGGPGAVNHWMNMLPYAWDRVLSTLQMGGGGLQASPNYDFLWTQRDYAVNAWVYDAPYVLFAKAQDKTAPSGEKIFETKNYEVRKLPSPGLVSPVHVIGVLPPGYRKDGKGHKAALQWLKTDKPIKDEVYVYAGYGEIGDVPHGKTLRAWHQESPGDDADIVAEVQADAPTTYIIRESWHPRWHAYIDGNETRVRRVTPDFPAVDVPAGSHTIEMRFERPWWAQAAWLAWPLAAVLAWLLARFGVLRRLVEPEHAVPTSEDFIAEMKHQDALRLMIGGAVLFVVGAGLTLATILSSSSTGSFVIALGPILGGIARLVAGIRRR